MNHAGYQSFAYTMKSITKMNRLIPPGLSRKYLSIGLICIFLVSGSIAQTKVVMLGSGNPNPDPEHHGPAVAVIVNNQAYLVDFGANVVRQAASLTPKYGGTLTALAPKKLNRAFLTHLHSDHTIGLPDLILTPWVMGRDEALQIWGPEGITDMADNILEAYREDISYRLYGIQPANNQGWRVITHEIHQEGMIYKDDNVTVEAFNVSHGSWPQCFGYKFTTDDKVIVISGDTKPSENLVKYANGADILVHEVYSYHGWSQKTEFWQKYHLANHTSSYELAKLADKIKPGLIILYHTLYWGSTDEEILAEISEVYRGKVIVGQDGEIY